MNKINLVDLVSAHREGVRLSDVRLGRNRARLLARFAAGAAIAASTTTSTAVAATTSHASMMLAAKLVVGLLVAGGAGAAYYVAQPRAMVATLPAAVQEVRPSAAPAPQPSTGDPTPAAAA